MPTVSFYKIALLLSLVGLSSSAAGLGYYYQNRTTNLNNQVATLNTQNDPQHDQIDSLKNQIANLTQQIKNLSSNIDQLQSANTQLLNQIIQLRNQLDGSGGLCSSGKTLKIGELLDLSADLSAQGARAQASSTLAISDINSFLFSSGCNLRVSLAVDDYALDNSQALLDLQSFSALGVQVVVGPLNSGAAQFLLSYANSNHIILISPSSTSLALAIPNDYLFRTISNDGAQALADARMMVDRGATALIIVQRHDSYGDNLAGATAERFMAIGGQVIDTIPYDVTTADFTTVLNRLQADFTNNIGKYGAGHIAFDFVSFEEFGAIILKAQTTQGFPWSTLPWFGTDGEAQDSVIVNLNGHPVSQVKLPSTLYATVNNTKTLLLYNRFASKYPNLVCDQYCLGSYDDVWLAALATLQAGSYDGTELQAVMLTVASNYYGVTGWMGLDSSGDRLPQSYQIWKVVSQGNPASETWVLAGTWDAPSDSMTWITSPYSGGTAPHVELL